LDVETVFEDAFKHGGADLVVVVGFGRDRKGPGTEGLAAAAARLVLSVVDIEESNLAVSEGTDTTMAEAFAAAAFAAARAGMGLGGATDDTDSRREHGLCS
jgi:hypothetical protein